MWKYKIKKLFLMGILSSFLLSQMVYASPEDDEKEGGKHLKNTIKNLKHIFHLNSFSEVLDYLIKENSPSLGLHFCHKNLSPKELTGAIQYRIAYMLLMETSVAVNFEQAQQNLKEASKWNWEAALNENKDAKKLFKMAFEIGPQLKRAGQSTSFYAEAL